MAAAAALQLNYQVSSRHMRSSEIYLTIRYLEDEFDILDLDNGAWNAADRIEIRNYWSGQPAPEGRHTGVRMLWSDESLYIRFEARQDESLVVNDKPELSQKTIGLWERDVCEIFVAPDRARPNRYFEFEIAPTGEWIDLGINVSAKGRETDWGYCSGIVSSAEIRDKLVLMAAKIPFKAFGAKPNDGDVWMGNLFRCVGSGPERGYLSWAATRTPTPNFHVPSKFGEFRFAGKRS